MAGDDREPLVSKSQRKRDALALQSLADALVQLSPAELETIPLPEEVRAAVVDARGMSRGAYRRQVRFLGRLLRDADVAPVREALEAKRRASNEGKARMRRLERWRERLMEEGDGAVAELLDEHPGADAQQLRQLLRNARRERESGRPPRSHRLLFRFLSALDDGAS